MKKIISIFCLISILVSNAFAYDYTKDPRCELAYLFSEGSGTATMDASVNGNNGSFASLGHPGWSSNVPAFNVYGQPLKSVLSDSTSYINTNSASLISIGSPITIVFWMYPTSTPAYNPHIFDIAGNFRLGENFTGSSATDLYFETAGSTALIRDSNTGIFSLNTWTWVAMTWDGSTTAANVHIYTASNSSPTVTEVSYATTTNGISLTPLSSNLYLLNRISDSARSFPGPIAQVGIFNAVMPISDLQNIVNYGLTGFATLIRNASIANATIY